MRPALALVAILACSGCAPTLNTPHAVLERREIDGELAYQAIVAALDADLAAGKLSKAKHDTAIASAWADLSSFRRIYNAGQDMTGALGLLQSDLKSAKGPN